ncbi:hypothetical protein PVAP13_9KG598700 [Panicum virgatum]|uniref:Uncharacterized protein n=2 Tax=Panicum virgatum TaxID=38727 RepID=A0A8T0P7C9_PANVG|nr:hypothetical protein PVAP13_9KG598700 [Panicum virgatum]
MASSSEQNINSGSFSGTDLSKKRLKESVSQTPELSERTIKIVYKRKRLADKKVGGSKLAATDEESTELNNDDDKGDGTGKAVHQEYTCLAESLAIENLPFMKTSSMWEYLESMEVFRNIPQRPNFSKFQQHVPELREGMALGLMISFTSLADNIKRLSIHDDDALFQEKMKGLSSLEADGFDVRRLRS